MTIAAPLQIAVGIVGAGTMGRGIAQVAATGGIQVFLTDAKPGAVSDAHDFVSKMLHRAVEKGNISKPDAAAAISRIHQVASIEDLAKCQIIIEAVAEELHVKQALFAKLETIVPDNCILVSNTSALSITSIAANCKRPERVAGMHFFNPVPLMKLVEVIDGLRTDPSTCESLVLLAKQMGREPVRCKDFAGFLAGNIGRGFTLEAARIAEEGVATFAEIDNIMRQALGFPMGPFQLIDNNGIDVVHRAMEGVYEQFYQEPYFRPSPLLRQRVAAGLTGRKSGQGFYRYQDGRIVGGTPATPAGGNVPQSIWISSEEPTLRTAVIGVLKDCGATIDEGEKPGASALCIVTPVGKDTATVCSEQGLDARRTIAVDALFGLEKHRTCMATPATSREVIDAALTLLSRDGVPVTLVRDSPGFIAQRIVAMIVNIGCWIAQSGFASPEDIDMAARLGLGYPKGPFEFGEQVGAQRMLSILKTIQTGTGDPRYRPSPWLSRRAALSLPLPLL
ncbi:MAG: 3-hydroxyacyl-CoA dehydrogenase [Burkholderiales bacterium]|nr:3-hydroxyacyl-CoA dehydrogenase [Burkholderiales bacterium]